MRRSTLAGLVIAGLVVVAGLGWIAGSRVRSPAEEAARTAAPEPSPILAPVEMRLLSTDVVTRGTGRFGSPREILLPASTLKDGEAIVTAAGGAGDPVAEGDVIVEVSGRPVFLLGGIVPSYRDLGPGLTGSDVFQLEAALSRLGYEVGAVDGTYDSATASAVTSWYRDSGYQPMVLTNAQLEDRRTLESVSISGQRSTSGAHVAADELQFAPNLPLRIAEVTTAVGQPVDGAVMTVTDAVVSIDSSVPVEEAQLVVSGMEVHIDEPDLGIDETGIVGRVAANPGTDGVDGFHVYFEVIVDGAPPNLVNASVRLTVPVESTGGEVLVVPVTAISLAPDGSSQVQRKVGDAFEPVVVEPGLSADGFVEITAATGLVDGDELLIGFELR